jgi:hypothetical protein
MITTIPPRLRAPFRILAVGVVIVVVAVAGHGWGPREPTQKARPGSARFAQAPCPNRTVYLFTDASPGRARLG